MKSPSFEHPPHVLCEVEPVTKFVSAQTLAQAETVFLLVQGMECPICAVHVRNNLLRWEHIFAVLINLEWGVVQVYYDPAKVSPEALVQAVAEAGASDHHQYAARLLA